MEKKKNSENSEKQNDKNSKNEGPENRMAEARHEKPLPNKNWDQAQRRNQASPRGYGDSTGIMKGERENGMQRMKEKDPKDQKDPKDSENKDKS
jgi:hypothetical protein